MIYFIWWNLYYLHSFERHPVSSLFKITSAAFLIREVLAIPPVYILKQDLTYSSHSRVILCKYLLLRMHLLLSSWKIFFIKYFKHHIKEDINISEIIFESLNLIQIQKQTRKALLPWWRAKSKLNLRSNCLSKHSG